MARRAPRPPSVVAEPPIPTSTRRAPWSTAKRISSPVPAVEASRARLPSNPPASTRPEVRAISITAVDPSRRQDASTGRPSGPVTRVVRFGPPRASRVPSPPSAIGTSTAEPPASTTDRATAAATATALAVPRNLSGAATTRNPAPSAVDTEVRAQDDHHVGVGHTIQGAVRDIQSAGRQGRDQVWITWGDNLHHGPGVAGVRRTVVDA